MKASFAKVCGHIELFSLPLFFYSNYDWILIIQLPTRAAHRQTYSGVRERAHYSDAEKTAHVHARSQKERQ